MKQYLDVLNKILTEGVEKESGRPNMPNTIGISNAMITMNLSEGFPLLTTKKMFLKGVIHELLWMLRGETNIKYLVDNGIQIWSNDAYRWYLKFFKESLEQDKEEGFDKIKELSLEDFVNVIKTNSSETLKSWFGSKIDYSLGDLGKVYGYQWRNQNGVDQIRDVIEGLRDNPYSRYHIIDAWQKSDFKEMALPPCHLLYQFIVRPLSEEEKIQWVMKNTNVEMENLYIYEETFKKTTPKFYLDLNMYQRSCDTFLGVPFNIASMSLLLMIIAKTANMIPGVATWIGGDTHLYLPHIEIVKEQISRAPLELPKMKIDKELNSLDDILALTIDDFQLDNYKYHPSLKAELFTGLKK